MVRMNVSFVRDLDIGRDIALHSRQVTWLKTPQSAIPVMEPAISLASVLTVASEDSHTPCLLKYVLVIMGRSTGFRQRSLSEPVPLIYNPAFFSPLAYVDQGPLIPSYEGVYFVPDTGTVWFYDQISYTKQMVRIVFYELFFKREASTEKSDEQAVPRSSTDDALEEDIIQIQSTPKDPN